jgi:hypothetical protein
MSAPSHLHRDRAWERFVVDHGHHAIGRDLTFILGVPVEDIERLRAAGVCSKGERRKTFAELFRLWYGREPEEGDWPPPRKSGHGKYEWQPPERALLASLVGRLGKPELAQALTERLRRLTGDPSACRSLQSLQVAINRIGMQTRDVVGGITTADAGKEIGSLAMVNQAIHKGEIRAARVGRLWVIPRDAWAAWKANRVFPPAGYVPLASLKQPLSIRSDKLSEYARMGYVPTALRCNPYGTGLHSTQFGTWYIDPELARQLIADRHAGRPMPWHGKPLAENLRVTYRRWQQRRHPETCKTCAHIWGRQGAPRSFEDYAERYTPLAHGAKRHLTLRWTPGLTVAELARKAGCTRSRVSRAIANGTVNVLDQGGVVITKPDAIRWISRGGPVGDSRRSWISVATAMKRCLFTDREIRNFITQGKLKSKTGTDGAMRGIVYVSWQQCASLRETIGFTEREAARRAAVTVSEFRTALAGVHWRGTGAIPLPTVQAVIKRVRSRPGYTIEDAAEALGRDVPWVEARIGDGTVRLLRRRWDADRIYLSEPMMRRLRAAAAKPPVLTTPDGDNLRLGDAALEAGVTTATIIKWANSAELERAHTRTGWRYPREAVRARARLYWRRNRLHRATPPQWLQAESDA